MDWLNFEPDFEKKILRVEFRIARLLELQPTNIEEADAFCQKYYPMLDEITNMCVKHDLKQVCVANVDGVDIMKAKPLVFMRMIWNIYEHTKNNILLEKIETIGGDDFFKELVKAFTCVLPPYLRNMVA